MALGQPSLPPRPIPKGNKYVFLIQLWVSMKINTIFKNAVSGDQENRLSNQSVATDRGTKDTSALGTQMHVHGSFPVRSHFYLVACNRSQEDMKTTLFAKMSTAMLTEVRTHYTSSKRTSRTQPGTLISVISRRKAALWTPATWRGKAIQRNIHMKRFPFVVGQWPNFLNSPA